MQITFTARHFKAADPLKDYAENEVQRLHKYYDNMVGCDIILIKEKTDCIAEISLKVSQSVLMVKERSEDFYKSIDQAVNKLERQLKKHKGKIRNYSHEKIIDVLPSS